jgi:S-adenosylmethionine decarboxylase proenzyme
MSLRLDGARRLSQTAHVLDRPVTYRRGVMPHESPLLYAADLAGCTLIASLGPEAISAAFVTALKGAGATVVQTMTHQFPGAGQTCVLILAESHAVLHTWPETGTVNLDIFSCSTRLKSLAAIEELRQAFGATAVSVEEISRADGHLRSSHRRA